MENGIFSKQNYILLGIGFVMLVVGYIALSTPPVDGFWTMNFAPVILTLAYCVVFPLAIIWKPKSKISKEQS